LEGVEVALKIAHLITPVGEKARPSRPSGSERVSSHAMLERELSRFAG
jgi:hypothetical protein